MRFCLLFVCCLFSIQGMSADFFDPMKPPALAMQKYRLEKLKNTGQVKQTISKSNNKEAWVLSSILYSSQRKHAIINNQVVKKGDVIQGAKLVRLNPDSVRLVSKGKVIDLTILDVKAKGKVKWINQSLNEKKI